MAKRVVHPASSFLKHGVKFVLFPVVEEIVRDFLTEFSAPPTLVLPDWNVADDASPSIVPSVL